MGGGLAQLFTDNRLSFLAAIGAAAAFKLRGGMLCGGTPGGTIAVGMLGWGRWWWGGTLLGGMACHPPPAPPPGGTRAPNGPPPPVGGDTYVNHVKKYQDFTQECFISQKSQINKISIFP